MVVNSQIKSVNFQLISVVLGQTQSKSGKLLIFKRTYICQRTNIHKRIKKPNAF